MFKDLTNEAVLAFSLRNEGPLLINSGAAAKIHPRPDMSFVRTIHNGAETIYLPGSSIKGVFRSRYEQVMRAIGQHVCDTFDSKDKKDRNTCHLKIDETEKNRKRDAQKNSEKYIPLSGTDIYNKHCCEACKLFGCLSLGGRISFSDSYPVGDWKVGMRHGVGIDRITGAAFPGALYDIETLEEGAFSLKCKMTNFKLYQLRTILWVLEDIKEGLVTFGMGGSRGNGQMRIVEESKVELAYRKYSNEAPALEGEEKPALFGKQTKITGLTQILAALHIDTKEELISTIKKEAVV